MGENVVGPATPGALPCLRGASGRQPYAREKGSGLSEEPKSRKDLEATLSSLPAEQNRSVGLSSLTKINEECLGGKC